MNPITQASGFRRARTYEPITRIHSVSDGYPVGCSTFLSSIHDARYYQGILSNTNNFAPGIKCDILHVQDGDASWKNNLREEQALHYIQVVHVPL